MPDNKDNKALERRNPLQTEHLLKEHSSQYEQPQNSSSKGKITENAASKSETLPRTDLILQDKEFNQNLTVPQSSYCPKPFNGEDPDLCKDRTSQQDTEFLKFSTTQTRTANCQDNTFPQSFTGSKSGINIQQSIYCQSSRSDSHHTSEETSSSLILPQESPLSQSETILEISPTPQVGDSALPKNRVLPQNTRLLKSCDLDQDVPSSQTREETITTVHCQSSPSDIHCTLAQASSSSEINPTPQAGGFVQSPSITDSTLNKGRTLPGDIGLLKSCTTSPQTSTIIHTDSPQSYPESRSGLDQDVSSFQTSKEATSVSVAQSSSLITTTTVTQQNIYCQSSASDSHCNAPQASSDLRSKQERPFSQGSGGLPEVLHASIPSEPKSVSNISISSNTITCSNRLSSKQSHQTVHSLHESLASTCTQQCVHDPGMNPSSSTQLAAPPQPETQTQALAQQLNPHVTPLSSSPHLLTPDQDPDICQPMAIREEIRLTPQIQGPSLPAPPPLPQAQTESLPQGKASKSGPPCFTRPLSRATVMEGSPVTLEVEVTGHPEPMLTWWVAYNQLHNNTQGLWDF